MSLHRVVMFEGGWGVFYYIRFLLERGNGILCTVCDTQFCYHRVDFSALIDAFNATSVLKKTAFPKPQAKMHLL